MSYSVKYILTFVSQVYSHNFRIEILKKSYAGEPILKRLGSAPKLIQDKSDGGVCGTSLELLMQSDADAELEELYTTDNRDFLVQEYMDDVLIWSGYILPEIYQEAYIAAPYDIAITCSDQLGVLKSIDYVPSGRKTILNILSDCLQHTGLVLGYEIISSLRPEGQAINETFFPVVTINDLCYFDKNCYEVVTEILTTINATLTQRGNRWLIMRTNDINTQSIFYTPALEKETVKSNLVAEIGSTGHGLFPIGMLNMKKEPAKKGGKFEFNFITAKSIFLNSDTEDATAWTYNPSYVNPPRKTSAYSRGGSTVSTKLNCFEMRRYSGEQSAGYNLSQTISVLATDDVYKFEVAYKGLSSKNVSTTVSLKIRLKVSNGSVTHYLTKDGWSTSEGYLEATGEPEVYSTARAADKEQYDKISVTFTGFPITGNLEIAFANNSTIAGMNDHQNPTWVTMVVSNVYLSINIPGGYESSVVTCTNASQDNRVTEFSFCDALALPNDWNIILNTLAIGNAYVDKWVIGNNPSDTFYLTMCKDHSNSFGLVRKMFTGSISGMHMLHNVYKDVFSNALCRLNSYTWNQLEDELTVELLEVATTSAILSEVEILTTDKKPVVISNQKQEISISHSHKNKEILDSLEIDGDGDLMFNGKAVGNKDHDHAGKLIRPGAVVMPGEPTPAFLAQAKPGEALLFQRLAGFGGATPGAGGLDRDAMWSELETNDSTKKVHLSHIPTIPYSSLSGIPSIPTWALAANKPVYGISEITGLQEALEGVTVDLSNYYTKTISDNRFAKLAGNIGQDFFAKKFVSKTLVIPATAPEGLSSGESAFYRRLAGFGGANPGAGGLDRDAMWSELATNNTTKKIHNSHLNVPAWALAASKPGYSYLEVGAAAASHEHSQYALLSSLNDYLPITRLDYLMEYEGFNGPTPSSVNPGKRNFGYINGYGSYITFGASDYHSMLYCPYNGNSLQFRNKVNGVWDSYKTIFHSNNSNLSTIDWTCKNLISEGNLFIKAQGNTCTIGSQNAGYIHFQSSGVPFYFSKDMKIRGDVFAGTSYNRRLAYVDEISSIKVLNAVSADDALSIGNTPFANICQQAHYSTITSENAGYYKITMPERASWMVSLTIRVYQKYEAYDILICGYNFGASYWYSPKAVMLGSTKEKIEVTFGYDGLNNLWIGIPAEQYTGLTILGFNNGYSQLSQWANNVTITRMPALTGTVQSRVMAYSPLYLNGGNLYGGLKISGNMEAAGLVIPVGPPSNPEAGKNYIYRRNV